MSDSNALDLSALVASCAATLSAKGWTLALAESCTGGLVSHAVTNLSGSSRFFVGGIVCYADRTKRDMVGVPQDVLAEYGAVSAPVARALAEGIRARFNTDFGLSITGIAGPTGGTPTKPVGTVFIGVSGFQGTSVEHHVWSHDRLGNKLASAQAALSILLRQIRDH